MTVPRGRCSGTVAAVGGAVAAMVRVAASAVSAATAAVGLVEVPADGVCADRCRSDAKP